MHESTLLLVACRVDWRIGSFAGPDREGHLTTTERSLLRYLALHPRRTIPRDELHQNVWGHAPSVRSRVADLTMRRLRKKLEADPRRPRHLLTVHGEGYRFEPLAEGGGGAASADAPAPRGLPEPATPLIGRGGELARLEAMIERRRLVTVTGPGGIGKTRLVYAAARRSERPAWFCEVEDARDVAHLCAAVAAAVQVPIGAGDRVAQAGRVLDGLGDALLVLDNLEQLPGAADAVAKWLALAPGLRVLVASRAPLRLPAEQRLPLEALAVEGAGVELLRLRAAMLDPDLSLDDALAARIVQAVEGIPLAIELAAARLPVLGVAALSERLDDPLAVLRRPGGGRADALRASVRWSWDLLDADRREALARCAVFRGSFDLAAAEAALAGLDGEPLDLLQELVERSLLRARPAAGRLRFQLFSHIRGFAAERLAEDPDALDAARRGCARHFAALAAPERRIVVQGERRGLRIERENLDAAVGYAVELGMGLEAARCLIALGLSLAGVGPYDAPLRWQDRVLAMPNPPSLRAEALWSLAYMTQMVGRKAGADALFDRAAALVDHETALDCQVMVWLEHAPRASEGVGAALERAERAARRSGAPVLIGAALNARARQLLAEGRPGDLERLYEENLHTLAAAPLAHATFLRDLAVAAQSAGALDRAQSLYTEAREICRESDHLQGAASISMSLGLLALVTGAPEAGLADLEEAEAGFRRMGAPLALGLARAFRARLLAATGRAGEGRRLLERELPQLRAAADPGRLAFAMLALGECERLDGEPRRALRSYLQAWSIAAPAGIADYAAWAAASAAGLLIARRELDRAAEKLAAAQALGAVSPGAAIRLTAARGLLAARRGDVDGAQSALAALAAVPLAARREPDVVWLKQTLQSALA